ncbi:hypothetical protein [Pseudomonas lini]|uniref:hypothetical protein n=1 Tax=Pseudomonas lini TaxID=163011 RepID=UPI000680BEF9|nr:hypothetical protein [Pseudomonas lini]KNH43913.1 hypothetical protein ACS73_23535 [Pseudomonas lini]
MTRKPDIAKEQPNTWTQGGPAKSSDAAATMAKFLAVTTDTSDLAQASKSTADAILANVKTSVVLKAGQPTQAPGGFKQRVETVQQHISDFATAAPEIVVQLFEQVAGVALDGEQKKALLGAVAGLSNGATLRDLADALKAKTTSDLGITQEQNDILSPLFLAIQTMQAEGEFAQLFDQDGQ